MDLAAAAQGRWGPVKTLMLTGDDAFTVETLRGLLADRYPFRCIVKKPENVSGEQALGMAGYARLIGLLRRGAVRPPERPPILREYDASDAERVMKRVVSAGTDAGRRGWACFRTHGTPRVRSALGWLRETGEGAASSGRSMAGTVARAARRLAAARRRGRGEGQGIFRGTGDRPTWLL
jgi:hypothetical protein